MLSISNFKSIVIFAGSFTVYEERTMALYGFDTLINCSVDPLVEQNSTIAWAQFYPQMLISETLKYTINATKLIIHNVTTEDERYYICYSKELAILYTIIDVIVTCKCFIVVLFTVSM